MTPGAERLWLHVVVNTSDEWNLPAKGHVRTSPARSDRWLRGEPTPAVTFGLVVAWLAGFLAPASRRNISVTRS